MKTIRILQHVDYEGPGKMTDWAVSHGIELQTHFVPIGLDASILDAEGLIVLGGPMGVADTSQLPWLAPELKTIKQFIQTGKPVLGICLGAQLIAAACGARVYPNPEKELGWGPVLRAPEATGHPLLSCWPESIDVFHWHGDTFDLPSGATLLGSSEACARQGFAVGNCLAFQFHIELGPKEIRSLAESNRFPEWEGAFVVASDDFIEDAERFSPSTGRLLFQILDRWSGK